MKIVKANAQIEADFVKNFLKGKRDVVAFLRGREFGYHEVETCFRDHMFDEEAFKKSYGINPYQMQFKDEQALNNLMLIMNRIFCEFQEELFYTALGIKKHDLLDLLTFVAHRFEGAEYSLDCGLREESLSSLIPSFADRWYSEGVSTCRLFQTFEGKTRVFNPRTCEFEL